MSLLLRIVNNEESDNFQSVKLRNRHMYGVKDMSNKLVKRKELPHEGGIFGSCDYWCTSITIRKIL